jgi:hypothetical protein
VVIITVLFRIGPITEDCDPTQTNFGFQEYGWPRIDVIGALSTDHQEQRLGRCEFQCHRTIVRIEIAAQVRYEGLTGSELSVDSALCRKNINGRKGTARINTLISVS